MLVELMLGIALILASLAGGLGLCAAEMRRQRCLETLHQEARQQLLRSDAVVRIERFCETNRESLQLVPLESLERGNP